MGYEEREPVALCDGCGQPMGRDERCWGIRDENGGLNPLLEVDFVWKHEDYKRHYCCLTPCLEKAVVSELRKLHAASTKPRTTKETPAP